MKTGFLKSILFALALSFGSVSVVQAGSRANLGGVNGGGGGTFLKVPGSDVLVSLDLFAQDPTFREAAPGERIPRTNDSASGQWIDSRRLRSFDFMKRRVLEWRQRLPRFFAHVNDDDFLMMEKDTSYLILVGTRLHLQRLEEVAVPEGLDVRGVQAFPVAAFDPERERVYVNVDAWNRAGLVSQAALLLHERLQHLQKRSSLPNELLQKVVHLVLLRDPRDVPLNAIDDGLFTPLAPDDSLMSWRGDGTVPFFQRLILRSVFNCRERAGAHVNTCWDEAVRQIVPEAPVAHGDFEQEADGEIARAARKGLLGTEDPGPLRLEPVGQFNPLPADRGEYLLEPANCHRTLQHHAIESHNSFRWGFECAQGVLRGVGELKFRTPVQDELKIQIVANLLGSVDGGSEIALHLPGGLQARVRYGGPIGPGFRAYLFVISLSKGTVRLSVDEDGAGSSRAPVSQWALPANLQPGVMDWSYETVNHSLVRSIQILK